MNNINYIKQIGSYTLIIAVILEMMLFPSLENLCGCVVSLYGWFLFTQIVFNQYNFKKYFLPTVAIAGYILMYFFLPIIMTLVELKPITYNFEVPYTTFLNLFININVIITAFLLCKRVYQENNGLSRLWGKIGFFRPPTDNQIWTMSYISLLFFLSAQLTLHYIDGADYSFEDMQKNAEGGGITSFFTAFSTYFALPICLMFRKWYGSKENKNNAIQITFFLTILLAIALISTRRAVLFKPIFSATIIYTLSLVLENRKILTTARFILFSILFLLITGPIADLAMAMALRRGSVKSMSDVVGLLDNRDELHAQFNMMRDITNSSDNSYSWDENYVNNVMLGYNNPKMHEYIKDRILYKIPTPIVHALGETKTNRTTPVDVMLDEYFHIKGITRIGNMVSGDTGAGLYWLGYWYYPVALIVYFLVFYFMSTLVFTRFGGFIIPIPILCTMQSYFMYFGNAYGIISSIEMLIRDGWMEILVYCLFFFVIRSFIK